MTMRQRRVVLAVFLVLAGAACLLLPFSLSEDERLEIPGSRGRYYIPTAGWLPVLGWLLIVSGGTLVAALVATKTKGPT